MILKTEQPYYKEIVQCSMDCGLYNEECMTACQREWMEYADDLYHVGYPGLKCPLHNEPAGEVEVRITIEKIEK